MKIELDMKIDVHVFEWLKVFQNTNIKIKCYLVHKISSFCIEPNYLGVAVYNSCY